MCVCNTELGEETDYYTFEFWLNKRLQNAPHHPHRNGNGNILKTKPLFLVLINLWLFFPVYPRPTKLEGVYWNHLVYSVLSYFIGLQLEITPYLVWNDPKQKQLFMMVTISARYLWTRQIAYCVYITYFANRAETCSFWFCFGTKMI